MGLRSTLVPEQSQEHNPVRTLASHQQHAPRLPLRDLNKRNFNLFLFECQCLNEEDGNLNTKPHSEGRGKARQTLSSATLKERPTLLCQSKKKKRKEHFFWLERKFLHGQLWCNIAQRRLLWLGARRINYFAFWSMCSSALLCQLQER